MKKPRGSLTTRLTRLEDRVELRPASAPEERDEAGWLAVFESLGTEGHFDREPDFPKALALFRAALAGAQTSVDPPFDPPPEFRPDDRNPHVRVQLWRDPQRFPELHAAFDWLDELLARVVHDIPPVSESEFAELAAWFRANDSALYELSLPAQLLDAGNGRRVCCGDVRWSLAKGPRADGAGRVAEDVRRLQARYGSRLAPVPAARS